jgi:hypothetical protein
MHLLAARLAGGGVFETATAGKPCCYKSMQHARAPETPTGKEDFLRALFGRFGYSPTASGALKKTRDGSKSSLRQLRTFKTHVRLFGSEIAIFLRSGTCR